MMQTIESNVISTIEQVCTKIKDRCDDRLHVKTFDLGGRKLRIMLKNINMYERRLRKKLVD
jgi:hypothetical protein